MFLTRRQVLENLDVIKGVAHVGETDVAELEGQRAGELDEASEELTFGLHLAIEPRRIGEAAFEDGTYADINK